MQCLQPLYWEALRASALVGQVRSPSCLGHRGEFQAIGPDEGASTWRYSPRGRMACKFGRPCHPELWQILLVTRRWRLRAIGGPELATGFAFGHLLEFRYQSSSIRLAIIQVSSAQARKREPITLTPRPHNHYNPTAPISTSPRCTHLRGSIETTLETPNPPCGGLSEAALVLHSNRGENM